MQSLRAVICRTLSLLVTGSLLLASALATRVACAEPWIIVPLTRPGAARTLASQFEPSGLYVAGTAWNGGTSASYAVRWDLLPLMRGAPPASIDLSGFNSGAVTVNGPGMVGGFIGESGVVWDVLAGGTVPPPGVGLLLRLPGITVAVPRSITASVVKLTDTGQFLIHTTTPVFLSRSGVGVVQSGRTGNVFLFSGDASRQLIVWDLAGDYMVGETYSRTNGNGFPYRAPFGEGGGPSLPIPLPTGFPPGTSGSILHGEENGDGSGFVERPGGAPEAARFSRDGTTVALGIPAGYGHARLIGRSGDMLIADAGKTGSETLEPFFRTDAPASAWMPLGTLLGPNSGWERLTVSSVNALGIAGVGDFQGTRTGFVIVPQSFITHEGRLTASPSSVVGGEGVQLIFTFPNTLASPRKLVKIAIADRAVVAFDGTPPGATLVDSGKAVLIPLQEGQTQVSLRLRTSAPVDGDHPVRITANASDALVTAQPTAFAAIEVTVRRP
jgi:hypothetical protein